MPGVTYDTGALVAAERDDRGMWATHVVYLERGVVPVVPAPVIAEAWRGGPRAARLARLLASCTVEPMTDEHARAVGVLAGRSRHNDVVDVVVVEGALRRGNAIVTGDGSDIRRIARASGADLDVVDL